MVIRLANNWWALAIRGLVAVIFGFLAIAWPKKTLYVLILWFAAFAVVDGAFALIAALFGQKGRAVPWWSLLLEGILGIVVGVGAAINPNAAEEILVYFVAAWAVVTGIFEILTAMRVRRQVDGEWALALAGIVSIGFGILIAVRPVVGEVYLTWMVGVYALFFGAMLLSTAFRLRKFAQRHHHPAEKPDAS